jgi:uncharacterized lipoprotein YmbA
MRACTGSRRARAALLGAAAFALGGCATAPLHYYTLVAPAAGAPAAPAGAATTGASRDAESFELVMGGMPADVDEPELVVREGGERAAILDGERWIAPLGDQVRAALSADLAGELPGIDVTGLAGAAKLPLVVKVEVRRFESAPGAYALLEAAWTLRVAGDAGDAVKAPPLLCSSTLREPVGGGYPALVRGHQRALERLAAEIAAAARALRDGKPVSCAAPHG